MKPINSTYALFHAGGPDFYRQLLHDHLRPDSDLGLEDRGEVAQHSLLVSLDNPRDKQATWMLLAKDGAVCVGRSADGHGRAHSVIEEGWFLGAWTAAADALGALGAHGPAQLVGLVADMDTLIPIQSELPGYGPDSSVTDSIYREIRRAQGHHAVEPSPRAP